MQQKRESAGKQQKKNTEDKDFEIKCNLVKKQLKRIKASKKIESRVLKMKFTV